MGRACITSDVAQRRDAEPPAMSGQGKETGGPLRSDEQTTSRVPEEEGPQVSLPRNPSP